MELFDWDVIWALRAATLAANIADESAHLQKMNRIDSELKAAEKTRGIIALLAPSSTYADHIVHPLRLAAGVATSAVSQGMSGRGALNKRRSDATGALNAVIRALQTRTLTHKIITSAQEAVDEWLAALDAV